MQPTWAARRIAVRPQLSSEQAEACDRARVLARVGIAGQERLDPWDPLTTRMTTRTGQSDDWAILVDQNGDGKACFQTVQGAVEAALARPVLTTKNRRVTIAIMPGQYAGLVYVPKPVASNLTFTFVGLGAAPHETKIVANIDAEMPVHTYVDNFAAQFDGAGIETREIFERMSQPMSQGARLGTSRSTVMRVEADGTEIYNLTIQNSYQANRKDAAPADGVPDQFGRYAEGQHQAVALHIAGADRVAVRRVHLKSFQDTLFLQAPKTGENNRAYFADCDIEGDVDYIFGQSTAYFESCTIRSLGVRQARSWAVAPATHIQTPFGFVFAKCRFTHDGSTFGAQGGSYLGRQWFEGVRASPYGTAPDAAYKTTLADENALAGAQSTVTRGSLYSVGKCLLIDCHLGAHIARQAPWDDWSGPGYGGAGEINSGSWPARYRPHQTCLADMKRFLSTWPDVARLGLDQMPEHMPWLGEFNTTHETMDGQHD